MDRAEYLKMCQKISMLKHGLCGTKENIPSELLVKYDKAKYYPIGFIRCCLIKENAYTWQFCTI